MVSHLYRIRPAPRAVEELETQTIFFAHPEKLNDPTEGLRDIFWVGDKIVWTNLLKHYLACLNVAWTILALRKEDEVRDIANAAISRSNPGVPPPSARSGCTRFARRAALCRKSGPTSVWRSGRISSC